MRRAESGKPELLAPAGDMERLRMAVAYGADAVYLAGASFGMRAFAGNFDEHTIYDATRLCKEAGVRTHVTINTMPRGDEVEQLLPGHDLYIDTSYTYGWCQKEQMTRIIRNWDPDKVLFGTDSPWVNQGEAVKQLYELQLPAELYDKIFYKNALRLLGMKE